MPITITRFELTPNPNAVKCWLDQPISDGLRSFRDAADAAQYPIAAALFKNAGATNVMFHGDWMTVQKPADTDWPSFQQRVRAVLHQHAAPDSTELKR